MFEFVILEIFNVNSDMAVIKLNLLPYKLERSTTALRYKLEEGWYLAKRHINVFFLNIHFVLKVHKNDYLCTVF